MPDQDLRKRFPDAILSLDDEQLRIIEKFGTLKSLKGGQSLVEAGARDPNFYVIYSGHVDAVEFPLASRKSFERTDRSRGECGKK